MSTPLPVAPVLTAPHPLAGRAALLTGASSGIGQALAVALAEAGVSVALVARDAERLRATADAARAAGAPAVAMLPCELTDDAAVRALPGQLPAEFRELDLLLHCAGTVAHGLLAEHPIEELDRQYRLNVRAPYLLTQVLLPHLQLAAGGTVVFVNSMAAVINKAENGQYAATKAALKAVADSLRAELAPAGGRVLSVFPGKTDTPLLRQLCAADGEAYEPARYIQPAALAQLVLSALSLPAPAVLQELQVRSAPPVAAAIPVSHLAMNHR